MSLDSIIKQKATCSSGEVLFDIELTDDCSSGLVIRLDRLRRKVCSVTFLDQSASLSDEEEGGEGGEEWWSMCDLM